MIGLGLFVLWVALSVVCFLAWVIAIPGTTRPTPQLTVIRVIIACVWLAGTAGLIYLEATI